VIKLNSDQRSAVDEIHNFVDGPEPFLLVEGSAGTGKSTSVQTYVRESDKRVCLTAPTNKATKVLREMAAEELEGAVDTATIFSLLGLRLDNSGEVRQVQAAEGANRADQYSIVVVDEGSMVNAALFGHICRSAQEDGVKFLFMGDRYQLPPVNEDDSQVMDIRYRKVLSKVERHDNQILTFANHLRDVQDGQAELKLATDHDEKGGVYSVNWKKMRSLACDAFLSDNYLADPGSIKVIAWRNAAVAVYNDVIREAMYGAKVAQESKFQVGERVVSCQPIMENGELQMATDEEGTVEQVEVCPHPIFKQLTCYKLSIAPEFGVHWINCWTIHESSEREYAKLLGDLCNQAKSRQGSWSAFWGAKEVIHDVRPCHAITAHRAQGSTYESAFVDAGDIMSNRKRQEALRCLYVGASRPRRILVLC
jgi:exodeoxyribonuclease-5